MDDWGVGGGRGGSSSMPCGDERAAVGRAVPLMLDAMAAASRTEGQPISPTRAAGG